MGGQFKRTPTPEEALYFKAWQKFCRAPNSKLQCLTCNESVYNGHCGGGSDLDDEFSSYTKEKIVPTGGACHCNPSKGQYAYCPEAGLYPPNMPGPQKYEYTITPKER